MSIGMDSGKNRGYPRPLFLPLNWHWLGTTTRKRCEKSVLRWRSRSVVQIAFSPASAEGAKLALRLLSLSQPGTP